METNNSTNTARKSPWWSDIYFTFYFYILFDRHRVTHLCSFPSKLIVCSFQIFSLCSISACCHITHNCSCKIYLIIFVLIDDSFYSFNMIDIHYVRLDVICSLHLTQFLIIEVGAYERRKNLPIYNNWIRWRFITIPATFFVTASANWSNE